ncbi:MAG: TIM barrel protein [Desulfobacteraceae bacterium]|jgi:sugar phosphate isomerase/epimerase
MHPVSKPVIAVSNKVFPAVEQLLGYCGRHQLGGIDYTMNTKAMSVSDIQADKASIETILAAGLDIRYHLQFYGMEVADADLKRAKAALAFHKQCLDVVAQYQGRFATLHIGLGLKSIEQISYETALSHLEDLVAYAKERRIVLCLENLTKGFTNHPDRFLTMIVSTGAAATFDLGHANASPWVLEGRGTSVDFLRMIAPHVMNAHVYEVEKIDPATDIPYHVAPQNLDKIEPLLRGLLGTRCDWWLIELPDLDDVNHSRQLLQSFLMDTESEPIDRGEP